MRLLQFTTTGELSLTNDLADDEGIPPYAILSHTWLEDIQEPTFEDLTNGSGGEKHGYEKIRFCRDQANRDGLQYFWVDTCCINKSNQIELAHAINSMFRWYRNAARCYVFLSDVTSTCADDGFNSQSWDSYLARSRWFTRGWTLQELLAPHLIEFFSCEGIRLGDRNSLKHQIQQITGVPASALQGTRLSEFSVDERFLWMERRQTKIAEDKVYSLLGLLDVKIPLYYGEGVVNASERVREVINKREECVKDLRLTDPRHDKKRIEDTKGGLLADSYTWVFQNADFQQWRSGHHKQSELLWIKGDPGKGKTMLLCGIINELEDSMAQTSLLSYFFCQATDSRINNATAVLRGLLYVLVSQQPSLISHVQKKYDYAGKTLFEDANNWVALCEIFMDVLQDPSLNSPYLIIDALDECTEGLIKLLDFLVQTSSAISRVKWIVSSRNWPHIEERLELVGHKLSLELNAESISIAVRTFIQHRVDYLAIRKQYDTKTRDAVFSYLSLNSNDTFLWAALVCQNLEKIPRWRVLAKLKAFPPGLDSLYKRMLQHISTLDDASLCICILASIAAVYRPITLPELTSLIDGLEDLADDLESLRELIGLCGSFLTIRDGILYFIHQSVKDFLLTEVSDIIFPSGKCNTHYTLYSRSLLAISKTLRQDMYDLHALGYPIEQVKKPSPDPLVASCYSCVYWIDHLCDWYYSAPAPQRAALQDSSAISSFFKEKYLFWLEALSLCKSMSKAVLSMTKLETLIYENATTPELTEIVQDARRFIMYHKRAIESNPLQTYASALRFSPRRSLTRAQFKGEEEPKGMSVKPDMQDRWSSCLQTLEGHRTLVISVVFSHDSTLLASASLDRTIRVWNAHSGECVSTLDGHSKGVTSVVFSHNSTWLASASDDETVKTWDAYSGECMSTLNGHRDRVTSVAFSHDSTRLASASYDGTVNIWDAHSGECVLTLEGHSEDVTSVVFSHDLTWLASASLDRTVRVWDARSGVCVLTLGGHSNGITSVVFSHDSTRLASASYDKMVKIWDARSGECVLTLEGHSNIVFSVVFSHDSTRLASASGDRMVKTWDARSGECVSTLEGHSEAVTSVVFSHDSTRLASASWDRTVRVWDARSSEGVSNSDDHSKEITLVVFSHDSTRLASASVGDKMIKVWDTHSGECMSTLDGHDNGVTSVIFSHDSTRLASASRVDGTVKVWDARSGECVWTFGGYRTYAASLVFSHDSTRLAFASHDWTVRIWDAHSGECVSTLDGHSEGVTLVVFSHDSTWLSSVSDDRTVKVWDTRSGESLLTLKGHLDHISSVAFSHDSTRLASGWRSQSGDNTVKIWDARSGESLLTLKGHLDHISLVAFSHDSTRLASASWDRTVKVWDARSGECLSTLRVGKVLDTISFDIWNSYLHTDIGVIDISGISLIPADAEPQDPHFQDIALRVDGLWITYNSENILRLPSEFRPSCSVVSGGIVGIGSGSGRVWIYKVERNTS